MEREICPRCGSNNTSYYLRGLPIFDEELERQLSNDEVIIGGCCVTDNDPDHHCNKCNNDFGYPTMNIEFSVTGIEFSYGGYFNGYMALKIKKTETGAVITYTPSIRRFDIKPFEKMLDTNYWFEFIHELAVICYIFDWKERYMDTDILDGFQWELIITFSDRKPLKCCGSNIYPPYWNKMKYLFNNFGIPIE